MRETADNDLLQRFQKQRDHRTFETLVEKYAPIVHGAALRRVGSYDLAQDVTQKVFVSLATKAKSIKSNTPLIGWLHQVTRSISIDLIRSESARKKGEESYTMDPSRTNDSETVKWEGIAPILDATLDELSADDLDALFLRFFVYLSVSQNAWNA